VVVSNTGRMVSEPFTTDRNRPYLDLWVIIGVQGIRARQV
jgi:hypothetical protein